MSEASSIHAVANFQEKTQDILKEDKVALQNYGRPYKNGRPVGNYYKHAKKSLLKKFC